LSGGIAFLDRALADQAGTRSLRAIVAPAVAHEELRRELARGEPFGPATAAKIREVLGTEVTREALERHFAGSIPNSRVKVLPLAASDPNQVGFQIFWLDNAGQQL